MNRFTDYPLFIAGMNVIMIHEKYKQSIDCIPQAALLESGANCMSTVVGKRK